MTSALSLLAHTSSPFGLSFPSALARASSGVRPTATCRRVTRAIALIHRRRHEPSLVQQRPVAVPQLPPRLVRQQQVVALDEDHLVGRVDVYGVLLRVVHVVVERGHFGRNIIASCAVVRSRGSDAIDECARVEGPRRAAPGARLVGIREHVGVRELRSVVVEAVHGEHDAHLGPRRGVEPVPDRRRERALPGARRTRDADEDARVAVAVAVEGRRREPRGELVDHGVHVLARGRPRRLHAGERVETETSRSRWEMGRPRAAAAMDAARAGGDEAAGHRRRSHRERRGHRA